MVNNYNYQYQIDNKITINCVQCLNKLKVPVDKGKILVTCPVCKKEFVYNPDSILHTLKQIFISTKAALISAKTKFPSFKARFKTRLKSYFTKNKKNAIILVILVILILVALIMSLFIKPANRTDTNINPGQTAILWK